MSTRVVGNIKYIEFLTSVKDEHNKIASPKLEVPEFQRNYVWKKTNIQDLLNSIKENESNYYLGNLVIVKDLSGRSKIVDGQQRLISLSLIAKVVMVKTKNQEYQDKLKKIIWADEKNSVLRVLFQKDNLKQTYENILNDIEISEASLDESQKILLKASLSVKEECAGITNIDDFIEKFLSLEFVVIVCYSDEDAYQLFEGLNSTGLSLSAVELTKNSILGKIKNLDKSKLDQAIKIWESLEKNFEKSNIVWFNKFLRHYWFTKEGYVSNSNLFREIKNILINKKNIDIKGLFNFLEELEKDSSIYISFRTVNLNKSNFNLKMSGEAWQNIQRYINYIEKLNMDQVYSVLLALYKYGKKEKDYFKIGESFQSHIQKLWQFLLIVKYTKISPSSFETDFSKVCNEIQTLSYVDFKDRMDIFYLQVSKKITGLEENFSSNLNSIDYSIDDRGIVKLLLEEYLTTKGEGSDSEIAVEHIVPENNLSDWNNVADKTKLEKEVGRIGNLTLLRNTLNSDAGHQNFDNKNTIAYLKSRYTVNNKLGEEWGDGFNSTDPFTEVILPRGLEIGSTIYVKYLKNLAGNKK